MLTGFSLVESAQCPYPSNFDWIFKKLHFVLRISQLTWTAEKWFCIRNCILISVFSWKKRFVNPFYGSWDKMQNVTLNRKHVFLNQNNFTNIFQKEIQISIKALIQMFWFFSCWSQNGLYKQKTYETPPQLLFLTYYWLRPSVNTLILTPILKKVYVFPNVRIDPKVVRFTLDKYKTKSDKI